MGNIEIVTFIFGGILLLVGILGGGFELKELKIPRVGGAARIIASIIGILFIFTGWGLSDKNKHSEVTMPINSLNDRQDLAPVYFSVSDQLTPGALSEQLTLLIDGTTVGTLTASQQYPNSVVKVTVPQKGKCSYTVDGRISFNDRGSIVEVPCIGQGMIDVDHGKQFELAMSLGGNSCAITILEHQR